MIFTVMKDDLSASEAMCIAFDIFSDGYVPFISKRSLYEHDEFITIFRPFTGLPFKMTTSLGWVKGGEIRQCEKTDLNGNGWVVGKLSFADEFEHDDYDDEDHKIYVKKAVDKIKTRDASRKEPPKISKIGEKATVATGSSKPLSKKDSSDYEEKMYAGLRSILEEMCDIIKMQEEKN